MKNIIPLFICLYLISSISAQTVIFEEDFDESLYECPLDCFSAEDALDDFGCLPSWSVSHGSIVHHVPIPELSDNSFIKVESGFFENEHMGAGLFSLPIDGLIPGNTYKVSIDHKVRSVGAENFDKATIKVFLADPTEIDFVFNDTGYNGDCFEIPPDVPSKQEILSETVPYLGEQGYEGEWLGLEAVFTVEGNQTPCLWIYSESDYQGKVFLDNIKIVPSIPPCLDYNTTYTGHIFFPPGIYEAKNLHFAPNNTVGYTEPDPDGAVTFRANESITICPNFYANPNYSGQLHAYIQPCGASGNNEERLMTVSEPIIDYSEVKESDVAVISKIENKEGFSNSDLKIIPNPNQGEFSVLIPNSFLNNENITISIYNSLGKMVRSFNNVTNKSLSINGLDQGIYTVILKQENNPIHLTQRVVVVGN